jgi:two-component system, NtrC family, C4-dicarboxylate transport sensor histidine kinase DctB
MGNVTVPALLVIAQAVFAGAIYLAFDVAGKGRTVRIAEERVALVAETLKSTIDRFEAIPDLVSEARVVSEVLRAPEDSARQALANTFLEQSNSHARLQALFVLNARGTAIASSNWQERISFIGHDYAFRPYFKLAMSEGRGRYYGVGVTTGEAGYFLAARTRLPEATPGVVVAKVDFSALETLWASSGENVMVSDEDGIVFLATRPELKFRPRHDLATSRAAAVIREQRYATRAIGPVITTAELISGAQASRPIEGTPWQITVVVPWTGRGWVPTSAAVLSVFAGAVFWLALLGWRQRAARLAAERRAYAEMELRVRERTQDLAGALAQLETEISERQRIDTELHRARDELVQAAKLAAMGRAFSGLAHEVNQPLAALRTYLSSTRVLIEREDKTSAMANIAVMDSAVQRLSTLTADLKRLSRRSDDVRESVDLAELARRVSALLKFRLSDSGANLHLEAQTPVPVHGNANRLEQVVMNLLLNAMDAVSDMPERRISLLVFIEDQAAHLVVGDHGPGIPDDAREHLFEPFFTTKAVGLGLGLAISFAIIRDHGGTITYERSHADETRFHVRLPLCCPQENSRQQQEDHQETPA